MKVTLLGPVSAESGGTELNLGGRKQRAVFALLALNAGRVVPMDRLVDELWRDEPPSRATLSLQSYMSRLRRLLAGSARIVTRPPGWTLGLDPDDVDVTRFVSLVSRARDLPAAEAVPVLREALALWQGDALADLHGLAFARDEATRLGELRLSATEQLLDAMLGTGQSDAVIAEARRFVAANPYHEHGWQSLMLALYRAGRQSEAVAAAADLRRLLVDDLGLDPSPETRELEQRILRQDPALVPAIPAPAAPVTARAVVGRAEALAQLDAAAGGRGGLLVFDAPAGLGKSTMLQALADRMRAAGGVVVRGGGVGAGTMPALWPWVTIVRELAGHLPAASAAGTPAASALAILNDGAGDATLSRTTLYRGVVDLLAAVAGVRPLAVLLDDAHWVDADTRTLLALAVDELAGKGVVFAVAVRTDEPGAADVHDLVARTRRDLVTVVPLRGLDTGAVGEMVRGLAGADVEPAVVEAITRRTAGNPLFVGEVVRLLSSERRLDAANVNAALPEHVRDVLRRRLDRLPGQTVALLTVVALAGGPADVDLLAAVTGLDAEAVLDSCESALLAELLVEDPAGFVLSHDLVRQTLEAEVSGARRIRLHAKLAAALQARSRLTPHEVLDVARHLRVAAPIVGPAAAVPYLLTASDDALSRYAHDQGEQLLDDALRICAECEPAERAALGPQIRGKLAAVRTWTRGVLSDTLTHDLGPPPADPEGAAGWIGNLVMGSLAGGYRRAAAIAEQALAEELPVVGRMAAHYVAGWAQFTRGRIDTADAHLRAFEELTATHPAVRIGSAISTVEVSAAGYASLIAHIRGDEPAADRALVLAEARARERSEPNQIHVELHHAWLAAMRGAAETARDHASTCVVLSERFGYPVFRQHASILAGWADAMLGDPAGPARIDAAYATYLESGIRLWVPMYLLLRAEAHGGGAASADLAGQARAASAELDEMCRSPRLLALSSALQRTRKP